MTPSPPDTPVFFLPEIVKKYRDLPYLIDPLRKFCYREFFARVAHSRERLAKNGIRPGDRVAICAPNGWRYAVLLWALWQRGAVAVPLSTRLPPAKLARLVADTACGAVAIAAELSGNLPAVCPQYVLEDLVPASLPAPLPPAPTAIPLAQDATIVFTSGSSGNPRGALHTFGNHYFNALGSQQNIPVGPGGRWLIDLPLYHVGGLAILFRAVISGGAVVFPVPKMPLATTIRRLQVTHLSLVATQLYRLLNEESAAGSLQGLQAILLGGSAIPPALTDRAHAQGLPVHTSYGATEMASQITTTPPGATADQLRTAGRLLPYREMHIAADGEILVRGKTLFRGYWQEGQVNPQRQPDGWFATGDLGRLDAQGFLHVTGRKDNRFISGGENIQAEEIEQAVLRYPGVAQVMVVPVRHAEFGQRPVAFVQMAADVPLAEGDLRRFLETELPRFKIPDHFFSWPARVPHSGIKPGRLWFRQRAEELLR